MRKMLNEWRKFLDEGNEDQWAWNPGGDEPLTRDELRAGDGWTKDDETTAALADIGRELRRRLSREEERLLVMAGRQPGFWGRLVMKLQDAKGVEDRVFNSVIDRLERGLPPFPEGEENF
jgi:hypothetical protein